MSDHQEFRNKLQRVCEYSDRGFLTLQETQWLYTVLDGINVLEASVCSRRAQEFVDSKEEIDVGV